MNETVDPLLIRAHVPRFEEHGAGYEAASDATRRRLPSRLNIPYGDGKDERLDLFFPEGASAAPRPIHMFVHGGYWRAQSKDRYAFVADAVTEAGAIAAVLDYPLMPKARMADLIDAVRRAVRWVTDRAASFGGDPAAISASGHSAGGHLASYLAARGPGEAPAAPLVRSALLVSGLYDLAPIARSYLQAELRLSEEEIAAWSPVTGRPAPGVAVTLAVGGAETVPFHEQAAAYVAILRRLGAKAEVETLAGEDHMTIVRRLGEPATPLASLLRKTIAASHS